ncbi:hypothetical protein LguiA_030929 [Lonicera macranthoides]
MVSSQLLIKVEFYLTHLQLRNLEEIYRNLLHEFVERSLDCLLEGPWLVHLRSPYYQKIDGFLVVLNITGGNFSPHPQKLPFAVTSVDGDKSHLCIPMKGRIQLTFLRQKVTLVAAASTHKDPHMKNEETPSSISNIHHYLQQSSGCNDLNVTPIWKMSDDARGDIDGKDVSSGVEESDDGGGAREKRVALFPFED